MTLLPQPGPYSGGTLADIAGEYPRVFVGQVAATRLSGPRGPQSIHDVLIERWAWNPPLDPPAMRQIPQAGMYYRNWAVTVPGDPTMMPGQRFLFFRGAGIQVDSRVGEAGDRRWCASAE